MGTDRISGTADRLRCCQLRRTVSVVNWSVGPSQFITLTVDICVQHDGREALRRAGLSAERRLVAIGIGATLRVI